ncbi:glycosyl hydrolase [Caulobacter sp. DWP3-1-3b2]|uniref:glycosyl hydrolase n=1 Tax=Caulobacter sp. DWP3-1-3b2 TaxID=2804643 RepID=UPI003CEDCF5B
MSAPSPHTDGFITDFAALRPEFSPAPFWWWVGGRLDVEQLCWQLDQLRAKGVFIAIVSYNHHPDGTTNVGDPAIFSDPWWEIFLTVLDHARANGMTIGIQDYCLLKPLLIQLGEDDPALRGAELRHVEMAASPQSPCALAWPPDADLLEATAWRAGETLDLLQHAHADGLRWTPDEGDWSVAAVFASPIAFNPLHPEAGARVLARFQEMIAERVGDHLGSTLAIFFQDELDFTGRWPLWSTNLPEAFLSAKGYSLTGRLAELWCERGPQTAKFRLDFADVAVTRLEDSYFRPVHEWHEAHGCLFGHDNAGRGAMAVGRDYYGDYFRTMRWYSAPGSDDPDLRGPRAFKGLKVASSIAHLYDRSRVWAECFHSSGWGATPAQILDGVNGVLVLGANLINLHGLYYTTAESWWEWAPPDFHFRQPYWATMESFNAYATRLSWLLSQGVHICDVAILYPSTALSAGLNAAVDEALAGPAPLSEAQRAEAKPPVDAAEASAFDVARTLFTQGVDFDIVDDASLAGSTLKDGRLAAGQGSWKTIVLPEMSAINGRTLQVLRDFSRQGGRVVALGALPRASDRAGSQDAELAAMVDEIFGVGGPGLHRASFDPDLADVVAPRHERDFSAADGALQTLHRRIGTRDVWFVRNPEPVARQTTLSLRAVGQASRLDPFTGAISALASRAISQSHSRLDVTVPASGATVVMIETGASTFDAQASGSEADDLHEVISLADNWTFALAPTMNNRFRDFDSVTEMVGVEIRRLDWCESLEVPGPKASWTTTAPTHAPRLLVLGPISPTEDVARWEESIADLPPGMAPPDFQGREGVHTWRDYAFSSREGILDDPFLKHWSSGPHGLKGHVPDDYIDLYSENPGDIWYLTTRLHLASPGSATLVSGSRAAYRAWLGGTVTMDQALALPPGRLPEWSLPHYDAPPIKAPVLVDSGGVRLLLRLAQPEGQRTRAHVGLAGAPPTIDRQLRWFADGSLVLDPRVAEDPLAQWFRFDVPAGATILDVFHRGTIHGWRAGEPLQAHGDTMADGQRRTTLTASKPTAKQSQILLRIDASPGIRSGDCLLQPVRLIAPQGPIDIGDWSMQGLASYSGAVVYRRVFELSESSAALPLILETGPVGAAASVKLNGVSVSDILAPPWRTSLMHAAVEGENTLEVTVFNTLANHYACAAPTPYVFPGQTLSGLLHAPRVLAAKSK